MIMKDPTVTKNQVRSLSEDKPDDGLTRFPWGNVNRSSWPLAINPALGEDYEPVSILEDISDQIFASVCGCPD